MKIKKSKGRKLAKLEKIENRFISICPEDVAVLINCSGKMEWELKPGSVLESGIKKCIRWE
jgi:hypothetical protein